MWRASHAGRGGLRQMFRDQDWISPNRAEQMDGPSYMCPCTFMKTMALFEPSELDQFRPDAAIVGAPWDSTTSWRAGTRLGPRSIRTANWTYPFYHLDLDVAPFDELRVIDYGDAVCPPGMCEAAEHAIWERVTEVASRGIFPVVLGGEHSITYPSAKAVADVVGHGKLGVIHFDAHAETVPDMFGNLYSHGTPMRRLIESGAVPGKNFVQIGLRGYWPPRDVLDWMKLQGMQWHLMSKVRTVGTQAVIEEAIEQALNGPEMIYISLDIDVHDPRARRHDAGRPAVDDAAAGRGHQRDRHGRGGGVPALRQLGASRAERQPGGHAGALRTRGQAPERRSARHVSSSQRRRVIVRRSLKYVETTDKT